MSDTPETREALERWKQGKINIGNELARLEIERNEARAERDKLQVMRQEVVAANKGAKINAQVNNSLTAKLAEARRERDAWREMAAELANAAAYGLAQWDQGYTLEASRKFTDTLIRFQKMQKEAAP